MTPLQIKMMLHYHHIAEPYALHEPEHANSSAVRTQRNELCSEGLLQKVDTEIGWKTTIRGNAYVDFLCAMPLPVCKWMLP